MSNADMTNTFMGNLIAQIWNKAHAESTGVFMVPSDVGGFVVVDTEGREWIKTVNAVAA